MERASEMLPIYAATEPTGLTMIDLAMHRARLDISKLGHDPTSATLTVILEHARPIDAHIERQRWLHWVVDWRFRIYKLNFENVLSTRINDTSHVGFHEIDDLSWSPATGMLTIAAVPPLDIEAVCRSLSVQVYASADITRTERRHAFGLTAAKVLGEDYLAAGVP